MLVEVAGKIPPGAWEPLRPAVVTLNFFGHQVVSSSSSSLQAQTLTQECEFRHQVSFEMCAGIASEDWGQGFSGGGPTGNTWPPDGLGQLKPMASQPRCDQPAWPRQEVHSADSQDEPQLPLRRVLRPTPGELKTARHASGTWLCMPWAANHRALSPPA